MLSMGNDMKAEVKIVTREQAYAAGLNKFFTGKPCKQGHIDNRYVSGGACVACMNKFMPRRHPFKKDLSPYVCPKLWVPSDATPAEYVELETYLAACVENYFKQKRGVK